MTRCASAFAVLLAVAAPARADCFDFAEGGATITAGRIAGLPPGPLQWRIGIRPGGRRSEAAVEEAFRVEFRPLPAGGRPEEEIELGEGELDVVFYEGGAVDLGEAVAQTLLLALDPYPRSPAAEAALREAGVKSEEEARIESSPFAALAALKGK